MLPRHLCAYHVIGVAEGVDGQEYGYRLESSNGLGVEKMRAVIEDAFEVAVPVSLATPIHWRIGWDL